MDTISPAEEKIVMTEAGVVKRCWKDVIEFICLIDDAGTLFTRIGPLQKWKKRYKRILRDYRIVELKSVSSGVWNC